MPYVEKSRRSIWTWGFQKNDPTNEDRISHARKLSRKLGMEIKVPPIPVVGDLVLRKPRIDLPDSLRHFCFTDNYERAMHSYGAERELAALGEFSNPPDVVAHPSDEVELEEVLGWCDKNNFVTIPYGGGSSVVGGVTPPPDIGPVVTIDMEQFDRIVEIDDVSRSARIQAGIFGPNLENDETRFFDYKQNSTKETPLIF